MTNSPWARLMTRIMPNTIASPALISARKAIMSRISRTTIAHSSIRWLPLAMARPARGRAASLDLHLVLLVVVRILQQVAILGGVGRRTLLCRVDDRELLVLDHHEMDVERRVVRLGVDGHCSRR